MSGDGNGWVRCSRGHRHWGKFGAAGLLVTDGLRVLLQHRSAWTHEGDTWAIPGGARDSHEDAVTAALREVAEETDLDTSVLTPGQAWIDEHGGWSYTTVLALAHSDLTVRSVNFESVEVRWWPLQDVTALKLHSGFAEAWPTLRELIAAD